MKLVFIGAGNMAEALTRGILKAGLYAAADVRVTDIEPARLAHFKAVFHVEGSARNADAVRGAEAVVLAVKPQALPQALADLKPAWPPDTLAISIVAGVPTRTIEKGLGAASRVIRVMPNTPVLVGSGAAAYCRGVRATDADAKRVEGLFRAVGLIVPVAESALDAVTAVSGSGPAYVFYLVEAMLKAAGELGLEPAVARALVVATVEGAARLLAETGLPPEELRRRVTSPGGTTAAAIGVLEAAATQAVWRKAIAAACARARELTQ